VSELLEAPCCFCGYNGQGYWQTRTHAIECPWYSVGGSKERENFLPKLLVQLYKIASSHELTRDSRDAATYRWLRSHSWVTKKERTVQIEFSPDYRQKAPARLDGVIRNAMAAEDISSEEKETSK